jgi:uncharacterized protein (TIRG00374 family)
LVIGIGLVWWLFRKTDWAAVVDAIRAANLGWLLVAEVLVLVTFVTRVQRWVYIVRSAKPVRWRALFSATQIGFLANFTLPGRVGELIRAVVLARLAALPFTQCFAFVALDRVTDLFGLIAMMLVAAIAFRPEGDIVLPPDIMDLRIPADAITTSAAFATLAVVGIIGAFLVLYLNQRVILRVSDWTLGKISHRLAERVHYLIRHFADGMHVFKSGRDMGLAVFFSLVTWIIGVAHYQCLLYAFHMPAPWYAGFVVMAFLAIAISVPGPPGFVGPFHVAIVVTVLAMIPATSPDVAKAAAIIAHLMNLASVVVVGVVCLYLENFGLIELRREGEHFEEEMEEDDEESAERSA